METLIKWREWGAAAFNEAKEQDKLILLDISAVWCHWCHVMDGTSYSDPEVASIIESRFIPVRVDTDRMPDVNERYNMGGWPTTAVLTPTGEVLLGATYVPPDKLRETLGSVETFYSENREHIREKIVELTAKKAEELKSAAAPAGDISENIPSYVLEELDRAYDPVHGGFGAEPKFPAPDAIDLLLTAYRDTGRRSYLDMAEKTLNGMSSYGMYDQVMGGFFRYSVKSDWTVPHFEKMLDVNAGLIVSYVNAWRITGKGPYMETVKKTLDYVDGWLWQEAGYFGGSQDADEEYYKLTLEERLDRTPPSVDGTMFTNLNARTAYAYLTAWEAFGETKYKDRAFAALEFILSKTKGEGGGLYHFYDLGPDRHGLLTDQSATLRTLLYAFQLTGEKRWLAEALSLLEFTERTLWDAGHGGFFDLPGDPGAVGALADRTKQMAENSEMSQSLKVLHLLTGDERYREMSRKCLLSFAKSYRDYGFMASNYANAVDFHLKPPVELTFTGTLGGPDMAALVDAAGKRFLPRRVVRMMDYARDREELRKKGLNTDGPAGVYVCRDYVCRERITDPGALGDELAA
ncbi:MAG TPA: DUF255 domain-containing protein [Nitrospirota bacterium]|nr:DUF255 domain-containing protein [Nitrospirota bacterium]